MNYRTLDVNCKMLIKFKKRYRSRVSSSNNLRNKLIIFLCCTCKYLAKKVFTVVLGQKRIADQVLVVAHRFGLRLEVHHSHFDESVHDSLNLTLNESSAVNSPEVTTLDLAYTQT